MPVSLLRRSRGCSKPQRPDPGRESERLSDLELYKISLDEYRFQVNLNWSRTQYSIALNLLVFGIATAAVTSQPLLTSTATAAAVVFAVGVLTSALALAAGRVQRRYYHSAREHKRILEDRLDLGRLAIDTTPGMKGGVGRLGKVRHVHSIIVWSVLLLDLAGFVVAVRAALT